MGSIFRLAIFIAVVCGGHYNIIEGLLQVKNTAQMSDPDSSIYMVTQ